MKYHPPLALTLTAIVNVELKIRSQIPAPLLLLAGCEVSAFIFKSLSVNCKQRRNLVYESLAGFFFSQLNTLKSTTSFKIAPKPEVLRKNRFYIR